MKFPVWILLVLFALSSCKIEDEVAMPTPEEVFLIGAPSYYGSFTIPSDNPMDREVVELGRFLFYEKTISADSTVSCGSCHQQSLAFTDGRALAQGIGGANVGISTMPLQNLLWVNRFFWNGRTLSLEIQAIQPIEAANEMNLPIAQAIARLQDNPAYVQRFENAFGSPGIDASRIAKALSQFQRTMISSNSKYDQFLRGEATLTTQEQRGLNLFFTHPEPGFAPPLRGGNCGDCHTGFLTTDAQFHNNGLETSPAPGFSVVTGQPGDVGKFRTPSMRNIAVTAPYMHDGRFATLEDVLDHYNEHIQSSATLSPLIIVASNTPSGTQLDLTTQEKADIIAFLHTLTDNTFLTNPKFSDPNP